MSGGGQLNGHETDGEQWELENMRYFDKESKVQACV